MTTKTQRDLARAALAASDTYDAATMIIARDGWVSAKRDANKTFSGPETVRYNVAHIDDLIGQEPV